MVEVAAVLEEANVEANPGHHPYGVGAALRNPFENLDHEEASGAHAHHVASGNHGLSHSPEA